MIKPVLDFVLKPVLLTLTVLTLVLIAGITVFPGTSNAGEDTLNKAQKEEIQALIRETLTKNPEIVIEAIETYQNNKEETDKRLFSKHLTKNKAALFDKNAPFAGNPEGDVVIVEFFDYNCGYCKKAVKDIQALLKKDKNLKVIFKDIPILRQTSHDAARWALAAHEQGKYFEYHVALMTSGGPKNTRTFEAIGKKLGLDIEKLRKDAKRKRIKTKIEENLKISNEMGIRGTPAFIIGDTLAPGYMGLQSMKQAIKDVRENNG